jgi:hypothetical protein
LEVQRREFIQKIIDERPRVIRCGVPPAQQIEDEPCCTEVVSELMKEILPQYSSRCNLTEVILILSFQTDTMKLGRVK